MIVVLDGYCVNPGDLSWSRLEALDALRIHDRTPAAETVERCRDAEIVLTCKTALSAAEISEMPRLRYIGVLSTGYNIVDIAAANDREVAVSNIPAYGTDSVAQFTMALLLELCHHVGRHSADVVAGGWSRSLDWSYTISPGIELAGKTIGIIGNGRIGQATGRLATAFGMHALFAGRGDALDRLLAESDVVSLHCPLTSETEGLINAGRIARMKASALLLNTARGQLIVEPDLADALNKGQLAGAGLDVLSIEPPVGRNPLIGARNCIVTPHIAWATREARARLLNEGIDNVIAFLKGERRNRLT